MRIVVPNALSLSIVVSVGLAFTGLSQPTVNFGITSAGPDNLAGVYTDPYHGLINQTTPVLAFCDDFLDDVNPPQFWTALVTDLSQLPDNPTTVYYSGGTVGNQAYSETTEYIAAAILAVQSLQSNDANTRNELSFALWGIFDPILLNSACSLYGCMSQTQLNAAVKARSDALTAATPYANGAAYENAAGVDITIYTPTLNGSRPSTASTRPQEFMTVTTPEPSSLADLALDSIGIGVIGLVLGRRRQLRKPS